MLWLRSWDSLSGNRASRSLALLGHASRQERGDRNTSCCSWARQCAFVPLNHQLQPWRLPFFLPHLLWGRCLRSRRMGQNGGRRSRLKRWHAIADCKEADSSQIPNKGTLLQRALVMTITCLTRYGKSGRSGRCGASRRSRRRSRRYGPPGPYTCRDPSAQRAWSRWR